MLVVMTADFWRDVFHCIRNRFQSASLNPALCFMLYCTLCVDLTEVQWLNIQPECQELLNDVILERQIAIHSGMFSTARTKSNITYHADYSQHKYPNDVEYRQHRDDMIHRHTVHKFVV